MRSVLASRTKILAQPPQLREGTNLTSCDFDFLRTYRMEPGARFDLHRHDAHQLMWSVEGVLRAETRTHAWMLSPGRGVWIPPEIDHDVVAVGPATLRTVYVHDGSLAPQLVDPTPVEVDELLRGVFARLSRPDLSNDERHNLERVMFDCIRRSAPFEFAIVMPIDERAREVATAVIENPADQRTIEEWAHWVGASSRTLSRLFVADTAVSFEQWRRDARLHIAHGLLHDGVTVELCARRVGYRSASAFGAAYRATFGRTPSSDVRRVVR